jgi:hypothetical protein
MIPIFKLGGFGEPLFSIESESLQDRWLMVRDVAALAGTKDPPGVV